MPTIRTPDGRRLRVPEGATQEQIVSVLRSQGYGPESPQAAPDPPRPPRASTASEDLYRAGILPESLLIPATSVENALRGARQGATFGFSDEAIGARDALGALLAGDDPMEQYRRSRDLERARLRQFSEESPTASILSNIGGGLATGAAGGVRTAGATAARGVGGRLLRSIPVGAGYGGLAGLGVGEGDIREQVESTGKGALIGGVAAPVITGGLSALSGLSRLIPRGPVTPAAPQPATAVPGTATVGQVAPVPARERALDLVRDTMRRSGQTPESIEQQLAQNQAFGAKPEMLADYLGDQGARRLYTTRTLGGPQAAEAVERIAARGEGTSARVAEDVQRATSRRGQSLTQLDKSIENRRKLGNTLYQRAFQHGEVKGADTLEMLQNPRVAAILKRASDRRSQVADLRGEKYQPLFRETEQGPALARSPTVEDLHLLKTSLDDDIRQAYQAGEGQLGNALRDFKNRIVRNLEEEVPAYRQARETYKGDIEVEEAIAAGRSDILRKPVDELRRDFKALSGAEKDAYRSGAIDTILSRKVDPKVDSSDFARSLWGNADSRARLQLLVKSEKELEQLVRQFEREQRMARTNRGVLGGSPTAMRSADIEDQVAGSLADVATQGPQAAFVSTVGRWIRRSGGVTEEVADDIAKLLTAEGPDTIRAVLQSLKGREQALVAQAMRQQQAAQGIVTPAAQQTNGNP